MKPIDRRKFIKVGVTGVSGLSLLSKDVLSAVGTTPPSGDMIRKVKLGKTGLKISQIGIGTGTAGYNHLSNQTRMGMEKFVQLARHAYDRGIRYFDLADSYGSHTFAANAMKHMKREEVELCTKIWTHPNGSDKIVPVDKMLDRFRKELNTDYIDIILLHCLMQPKWSETRSYYIDALSKAKQDGLVKAVGVSCHNWDAMVEAVDNPWTDVLLARINPFQSHMDGTPEAVNAILGKAVKNGKGVIGMKIFGEGKHVSDEERERSLIYAIKEANIHCMTIGLESEAQVNDLVLRVTKTNRR